MSKVKVSFLEEKESAHRRLGRYYDLIAGLALRDVKMRYQLSILGLYWAVLNPLLMALIWSFVFSVIFRAQGIAGVPYFVFLFCGITFWNLFSNSLMTAVNSLTGNASLLSKLYFPRAILPTASVMARLVDFAFSLVVLGVFMAIYKIVPGKALLWLPVILFFEMVFTLGMAYIVSALNVLYRDVSQTWAFCSCSGCTFHPFSTPWSKCPPGSGITLCSTPSASWSTWRAAPCSPTARCRCRTSPPPPLFR